ncbi:MAG: hypothetical protein WBD53_05890 [Xanthobacteraceae bacterium]
MPRRGVRVVAVLALIAPAALAMSGCSPVSQPSLFPSVEEAPPQRADTPMDANQIQQATQDLITDRNRLSAEAQGGDQPAAAAAATKPTGAAQNAVTTSGITPIGDTETK